MARKRHASIALLVSGLVVASLVGTPTALAQPRSDPAATAYGLSEIEQLGEYSVLYDMLHPSVLDIVPRSAVVGWYENEFGPKGPQDITVTDIAFVTWTWPVTGETFQNAAEISYFQPFADGTMTNDVMHLVEFNGSWRWFFGKSLAFIEEQIALYPETTLVADTVGSESCQGAASWWKRTYPNLMGLDYLVYTTRQLAAGGSDVDSYTEGLADIGSRKERLTPPPAGEDIQDEFLALVSDFEAALDNPDTLVAALDDLIAERDARNEGIDVFLGTCAPLVVFLFGGGEDLPVGVVAGEPLPKNDTLECGLFDQQDVDVETYFTVAGNDDMYALDDNDNGIPCEPGEGPVRQSP